jgi:hypothetical protein
LPNKKWYGCVIQEIVLQLLDPIGIAIRISTEPTKIQIPTSHCANPPIDYSVFFFCDEKQPHDDVRDGDGDIYV